MTKPSIEIPSNSYPAPILNDSALLLEPLVYPEPASDIEDIERMNMEYERV